VKSLAAVRYSKDSPEEFGLEPNESIAEARSRYVRTSLLSNAVRITPRLFPALARAVGVAHERLDPALTIEVYVTPDANANASCIALHGDVELALVLTSSLVELLREEELPFVAGHEIGHHLFGHARYPRAGDDVEEMEHLKVLALHRASEVSADRLGFICSPTAEDAFRGMLKVASGLSDRHIRFDLDSYLAQLRDLQGLAGHQDAIYETHPMFPLRIRALLWFSMSEPYYYWTDHAGRASIATEVLDEKVEADFRAASGYGLDHIQSSALRSVKIWAAVWLVSLDNRIGREEQRLLAEVLGKDEAERAVRFVAGCGNDALNVIQQKLREAYEGSREAPEKLRAELLEEIERVASASGGEPDDRLRALAEIAAGLDIDREVEIRPWTFRRSG
jgi:hypothetical protein